MDEIGRILMTQVNILFIVLIVCAIIKMKYGFEEGFSKGLYRIVVTIVSIIVILEIIKGIRGALLHQTLVIISAVISLLLILVIYKIINLPLISLKLMAKTPGLHALDKVLGSALGMIECLLLFWIAFVAVDFIKYEPVSKWIIEQANGNFVISFLYNKNYIKEILAHLLILK